MIINEKELCSLIKIGVRHYFNYKDIVLDSLDIKVDQYIHFKGIVNYYGSNANIKGIIKIDVNKDIYVYLKGIIKYNILSLDLDKIIKDYIKDYSFIEIEDDVIRIKNLYINDIKLNDGYIEIELDS